MKPIAKYMIIAIISALIVYLTIFQLKPMIVIKLAFKNALNSFSPEIVANCERIFRLETNHFKSGQFKGTFSPGMEKFGDSFPYGWNTVNNVVWSKYPQYKPIGFKTYTENQTGIKKTFLKFPSVNAAVFTVCGFLNYYDNNAGRWFSTNVDSQVKYSNSINKIIPDYTNESLA